MPYQCTATHDIIEIAASREVSLLEVSELIRVIASSSRCDDTTPVLVDLRGSQYRPKLKTIRSALLAARDSGAFTHRRVALVAEHGMFHGVARMTEVCARIVGLQVALFEDVGMAKQWTQMRDRHA